MQAPAAMTFVDEKIERLCDGFVEAVVEVGFDAYQGDEAVAAGAKLFGFDAREGFHEAGPGMLGDTLQIGVMTDVGLAIYGAKGDEVMLCFHFGSCIYCFSILVLDVLVLGFSGGGTSAACGILGWRPAFGAASWSRVGCSERSRRGADRQAVPPPVGLPEGRPVWEEGRLAPVARPEDGFFPDLLISDSFLVFNCEFLFATHAVDAGTTHE